MPVQGRLVSAKEFENSGREVSIDEAGFPDADLVLNSSIGSRIESQASLGDLVEDEEYEAATHTFVIQPWRSIKRLIAAVLAKAPTQSTSAAGSHVSLSSKEHVQGRSGTLSPQPTQQATILPVTIPHGFQLARHLGHHRPTVKTALYIPSPHVERFATLDSHHVNIWRGSRSLQIPTGGDRGAAKTTVAGLSRWLYIAKWKVIIIATLHLELKILDANFEEIASVSSVKPVLSLEYNDDADELIAGGVGNIRIWSFRRSGDGRAYRLDPPRLIIEDLGAEDWVAHAVFQKTSNRIYAAIDNRIHIYDYEDGKRIDTLYDVHDLSITALAFYEPLGTLITASRDSTIKVWNRQNNLIHELREHSHAVTGIAVIPPPEKKGRGLATLAATPYFLSCSLDGTIRMWNAEVGACTYSLQTPQECLGIRMIKPDCFMHFAKDRVCIWNLNRFYSTFAYIRSQTTQILRASHPLVPARIIAAAEDGSLRILSPVTGAVLSMGFPVMHERTTLDMIYDLKQNIAWLLSDDSALAVYSTKTNPCAILGEWQVTLSKSKLTCMTAISTASHSTQDLSEAPVVYGILGGTDTGQVMLVDVRRNGEQSVVVQAHTAEIHTILFEPSTMQLFTSGKDNTLKIWSLSVTTTSFQTLNGADPIALAAWYANANLSISATLVGNVSTEGLVHRMLWFSRKRLLLCAIGNRPVIYGFGKKGLGILRSHSSDDDHLSEITMLALCDMNRIFATSSLDGSVKIWDAAENVLIRELQFAEPIATLCFANPRGDLLISLPDQIVLVKLQDYMPIPYLRLLYERGDIPDDVPEDPTLFDSNLDFWQLYKEEVEEGEIAWHVDEKLKNDGLGSQSSNLNELENIREQKEQATLKAAEEAAKPKRVRKAVHRMVVTTLNDPIDFSTIFETQEPSLYVPQIMHTVDEEKFMEDEATIMEEPDNQEPESQLPVAIMLSPRVIPQQSTEQIYARARKRRMSSLGRQGAEKQTHGAEHDSSDTSSEDVRDSVSHAKDPAPLAHSSHEQNRRPSAAVRELTMSRAGSSQLHIGRSGEVGPGGQDAMRQELAKRRLLGRADELRRMTSADSGRRRSVSLEGAIPLPHLLSYAYPEGKGPGLNKRRGRPGRPIASPRPNRSRSKPSSASGERIRVPIAAPVPVVQAPSAPQISRQTLIRNQMERMGILPNSVLTGQTQPALARKREKEEESRKERDKDVISKGRAIVERRRAEMAQERAAKGIVDPVASNLPNPSSEKKITANLANDGARVEPPSMSATLEKAREEARAETEAQKVEGDIEVVKHKMSDQSSTFGREETFARTNAEPELIKTATINSAKKTSRKVPLKAETRKPVEEFNNKPLVTDGEMLAAIIVEIQPDDVGIVSTNFGGATPISIHEFGPGAVTREKAPSPSLPPLADVVKNQTPQKARRAKRSSNAPAPTLQSPKLEKKEVSKKHGMNVEPIAREKSKTRRTRTPKTITEVLEEEDLLPELQAILSKRWFPSLEGREITIRNILSNLLTVYKVGYWSEKCEAADSIFYIYEAFGPDFRDSIQEILFPQVEGLGDPDWQLRLHMCKLLARYDLSDPILLQALISRLIDPVVEVRNAAMQSLATFGIDTKTSLRNAMIRLRMLPSEAIGPRMNWLDILLARIRARQEALLKDRKMMTGVWLQSSNFKATGREMTRPASSIVTLVPPPKDGEMTEFVMPIFSNDQILSARTSHSPTQKHLPHAALPAHLDLRRRKKNDPSSWSGNTIPPAKAIDI